MQKSLLHTATNEEEGTFYMLLKEALITVTISDEISSEVISLYGKYNN